MPIEGAVRRNKQDKGRATLKHLEESCHSFLIL
jgi:hypothetical protein